MPTEVYRVPCRLPSHHCRMPQLVRPVPPSKMSPSTACLTPTKSWVQDQLWALQQEAHSTSSSSSNSRRLCHQQDQHHQVAGATTAAPATIKLCKAECLCQGPAAAATRQHPQPSSSSRRLCLLRQVVLRPTTAAALGSRNRRWDGGLRGIAVAGSECG